MNSGTEWIERREIRSLQSGIFFFLAACAFSITRELYDPADPLYSESHAQSILSLIGAGGLLLVGAGVSIFPCKSEPDDSSSIGVSSLYYVLGHALLIAAIAKICEGVTDYDHGYNGNGNYIRLGLFVLAALGSLWSLWKDPVLAECGSRNTEEAPLMRNITEHSTNPSESINSRPNADTPTPSNTGNSYFWTAAITAASAAVAIKAYRSIFGRGAS